MIPNDRTDKHLSLGNIQNEGPAICCASVKQAAWHVRVRVNVDGSSAVNQKAQTDQTWVFICEYYDETCMQIPPSQLPPSLPKHEELDLISQVYLCDYIFPLPGIQPQSTDLPKATYR